MQKKEESNRNETEEMRAQAASEMPQSNAVANPQPNSVTQKPKEKPKLPGLKCGNEKLKQIQQQILLYLHTKKCLRQQRLQADGTVICSFSFCQIMRNVLRHMPRCQDTSNCTVAYCSSTRKIIGHWNDCRSSDCPICGDLREVDSDWRLGNTITEEDVMDLEQPIDVSNWKMLRPEVPTDRSPSKNSDAPKAETLSLSSIATIADVEKRLIRMIESLPEDSSTGGPDSSFRLDIDDITPIPSQIKWYWHVNVSTTIRKYFIKEMIKIMIITIDRELASVMDRYMLEAVYSIQKSEGLFFEISESKAKYIYRLAEKIYTLQTEFTQINQIHEERVDRIGRYLQYLQYTNRLPDARLPSEQESPQTHQQRQSDYRPHRQRPWQTVNLRRNPMQSPRRQPTPSEVDLLLNRQTQLTLRLWYKTQRQFLFQLQRREQTVPSISSESNDADDILPLSI